MAGRKGRKKLIAFVDNLVSLGAMTLRDEHGLADNEARETMRSIANSICALYGRSYMYVPMDLDFKLIKRDHEIWGKYTTNSSTARRHTPERVKELAAEYDVTREHMYCILRLMRVQERAASERDFAARQGTLPGIEAAAVRDEVRAVSARSMRQPAQMPAPVSEALFS